MSDVFISYSRKDKAFVQKLHEALKEQGRETWVDWEKIEWTEDWWKAIEQGIEGTNTFVFVISPNSVESSVCRDEIDNAVKHNKRLVPIVYQEVNDTQVHGALKKLNWLFFRDSDPFDLMFRELVEVLDKDLEYVREHTRILEKAIEWDNKNRNECFLLRGDDLKAAETWLDQEKMPKPTGLQREYISASRTTDKANQILLKAGQTAKRRIQIGSSIFVLALIGSGAAASWAWRTTEEATAWRRIEQAGTIALNQFDTDPAGGLLLAIEVLGNNLTLK